MNVSTNIAETDLLPRTTLKTPPEIHSRTRYANEIDLL
jgi:hypothetical protein